MCQNRTQAPVAAFTEVELEVNEVNLISNMQVMESDNSSSDNSRVNRSVVNLNFIRQTIFIMKCKKIFTLF